jgi:predicted GNAT family N-acyltransferase
VLRPHLTLEQVAAAETDDAVAFAAFDGERLVATGLIVAQEQAGVWRVRGMATEPDVRGAGAGSAVLAALLSHAQEHGGQRVWCNARSPARTLYERAGFRATSEEFELAQIGPHFVMELRLPRSF